MHELARRSRTAARTLALASRAQKDAALLAMADALVAATARIVAENAADVETARADGTPENVIDRLLLDADRVAAFAQGVRDVAALPDPVGEVVRGSTLPNGLRLEQIRVPMGVIGMIYEGRPNVTADAAAICLKAGSASLLRGSRSAARSNAAIVDVMRDAIAAAGLPADVVQAVPAGDRSSATELMQARGLVDRSLEHLGTSDKAIVAMRRIMLEAIQDAADGKAPRGLDPKTHRGIRPYDGFMKIDEDWRDVFGKELVAKW